MHASIRVIGIGMERRGDDEAGLRVARILKAMDLPEEVSIIETTGDGASLMEQWKGWPHVILVDALRADTPTGTVLRIDMREHVLPADVCVTTSHAFGLAQALAIGLALDELPPSIVLFGIQGQQFDIGSEPSMEVSRAIRECADSVRAEIHKLLKHETEAETLME